MNNINKSQINPANGDITNNRDNQHSNNQNHDNNENILIKKLNNKNTGRKNIYRQNINEKNVVFNVGLIITCIILAMVAYGIFSGPEAAEAMSAADKFGKLSPAHPMGFDQFGRDVFVRVCAGIWSTVKIALGTILLGGSLGVIIGALCGYFGGYWDEMIMRVVDVILAFPSVLLALLIISLFGTGSIQLVFALGISFFPSFARVVRGEFMRFREMDFARGARLSGASHLRIVFVHILPNLRGVIVSSLMIGFNNAVLAEAGLSYLGLGIVPPNPSLGKMLSEAQTYIYNAPSLAIFPGVVLIFLILGVSLMAGGLEGESHRIGRFERM